MNYDFIEIGTSDFDTLLEKNTNQLGISIEPIKLYLDNLPDKPTVIKLNCAISDIDGVIDVYWLDPIYILNNNLPYFLRGCNSINEKHPTVVSVLSQSEYSHIPYNCTKCECLSWDTLILRYDVKQISYLKIDTEGHDLIILKAMMNSKFKVFPVKLMFENNSLTNPIEYAEVLSKLTNDFGYNIVSISNENVELCLA